MKELLYKSPQELARKVEAYAKWIELKREAELERGVKKLTRATITGMAHYLGLSSRKQLDTYASRSEEFKEVVDRARLYIESQYENALNDGSNPAGAIFALKNMGWSDKQEVVHSGGVESTVNYVANIPKRVSAEEEANLIEQEEVQQLEHTVVR